MTKFTKRSHIHPKLRIALYSILLVCGGLLFVSIIRIFRQVHASLGQELAEVAVSIMSILILVLIAVGMRAGWSLDRFIRHRKIDAWKIRRLFRKARPVLSLLGYEEVPLPNTSPLESTIGPGIEQTLSLIERPKRRGRPPTHSFGRWVQVVLAWENRDPYRNPMTLNEFLSMEFGTHADGSPSISENTFYENRKKVFEELRKNAALNKEPSS